jgi:2-polyprenyl-6-methoxyphenol hydroxylase-like FAD-dependent oxidoreductase
MEAPKHDIVIAGGGPAGMMAGYLFARAGVRTLVLEKHADFLRDFRGDTVHPSTLDLFDELGLLEGLLARPHDMVPNIGAIIAGREYRVADFTHLPVRCKFVALMPQWEFLNYLAEQARRLPNFELRVEAEAVAIIEEEARVVGLTLASGEAVHARLIIAADGRGSILRKAAALPLEDLGAPMDIFWFRIPKPRAADNSTAAIFGAGGMVVLIDRGDYWQCARVIAKGSAEIVREKGIAAFRTAIVAVAPRVAEGIEAIRDWDDVKLLSVSLDRLTRWHRPGLLAIGDAAHAMSPVGGVGINLAIQDAVAAANILAAPLAHGGNVDALLGKVQQRRLLPTRVVQGMQRIVHDRVIGASLRQDIKQPPFVLRLFDALPLLQRIPARIVGLGVRREHIRSPVAPVA